MGARRRNPTKNPPRLCSRRKGGVLAWVLVPAGCLRRSVPPNRHDAPPRRSFPISFSNRHLLLPAARFPGAPPGGGAPCGRDPSHGTAPEPDPIRGERKPSPRPPGLTYHPSSIPPHPFTHNPPHSLGRPPGRGGRAPAQPQPARPVVGVVGFGDNSLLGGNACHHTYTADKESRSKRGIALF